MDSQFLRFYEIFGLLVVSWLFGFFSFNLQRLPTLVAACVGGGSNAIGIFASFIDDKDVDLFIGYRPAVAK